MVTKTRADGAALAGPRVSGRVRWTKDDRGWRAKFMGAHFEVTSYIDGHYATVWLDEEQIYDAGPMALSSAKTSCRSTIVNRVRALGFEAAALPVSMIESLAVIGQRAALVLEPEAMREFIEAWKRERVRRDTAAMATRLARGKERAGR